MSSQILFSKEQMRSLAWFGGQTWVVSDDEFKASKKIINRNFIQEMIYEFFFLGIAVIRIMI
jgi:hypothetical protein